MLEMLMVACAFVLGFVAVRWYLTRHERKPANYEAALYKRNMEVNSEYWRHKQQQIAAQRWLAKKLNNSDK